MKIVFLGTNGWYDSKTGNANCVLIDSENYYVIVDAGNGIYKVDQYINKKKPIYLFISHLHIDHIAGLHILNKFKSFPNLTICSYKGSINYLKMFVNDPFTIPFNQLPYKIIFKELSEGDHNIPFHVTARRLAHSGICFGYRFELENKIITYCADTGICQNDFLLSKDADILIHECSNKINTPSDKAWGHVIPEEAAELAKKANVKKLLLTHFAAHKYLSLKEREEAQQKAQKIFKNTIAAKDGMIIEV